MDRDIVYDESEMSIAANKLLDYAEFLGACVDEYVKLLQELKSRGIKDEKVCARIEELICSIMPYRNNIFAEGEELKNVVNKSIKELADADKYTFNSDAMNSIPSIVSALL